MAPVLNREPEIINRGWLIVNSILLCGRRERLLL